MEENITFPDSSENEYSQQAQDPGPDQTQNSENHYSIHADENQEVNAIEEEESASSIHSDNPASDHGEEYDLKVDTDTEKKPIQSDREDEDTEINDLEKKIRYYLTKEISLTDEQKAEIVDLPTKLEQCRHSYQYLRKNYYSLHPEEDPANLETIYIDQVQNNDIELIDHPDAQGNQLGRITEIVYLEQDPNQVKSSKKKSRKSKSSENKRISPKMQKYQEELKAKLLMKNDTLIADLLDEEMLDIINKRSKIAPTNRPPSSFMTIDETKLLKKSMYKKTPEQILLGIRMGEVLTPSQKIIQFEQEFDIPNNYILKSSSKKRKNSTKSSKLSKKTSSKSEQELPNMPRWGGFRVEPLVEPTVPDENSIEVEELDLSSSEEEDFDDGIEQNIKDQWKSDTIQWKFDLLNIASLNPKSKPLAKKLIAQYEVEELFRGFQKTAAKS